MKRIMILTLAAMLLMTGAAAMAEGYRVSDGNVNNFATLFQDLLDAFEAPAEGDAQRIGADLEAIRGVSEEDYAIARGVAEHWQKVYLDPDYPLYLYDGGVRATALEAAGYQSGDIQAVVVLGYELRNGEMTEELKGRCDAAAAVARSFPDAVIVCSGGATGENNPKGHTEAGMMRDYLVERCDIDAGRILTDERALTTTENAINTFAMLEERDIKSMTIVTSAYHQRRGQVIYNAVGMVCARESGYAPEIVANYCLDIEPANERLRNDAGIALRQIGEALGLTSDAAGGRPPKKK